MLDAISERLVSVGFEVWDKAPHLSVLSGRDGLFVVINNPWGNEHLSLKAYAPGRLVFETQIDQASGVMFHASAEGKEGLLLLNLLSNIGNQPLLKNLLTNHTG